MFRLFLFCYILSNPFYFSIKVHVPGPPKNLKAAALSPTSIHISWDLPESAGDSIQKYKIFFIEDGKYTIPLSGI